MPLVKAKFQWDAQDATELSFKVGDVINVDDQTQEGWWHGSVNGKKGYFPNNYVEPMPSSRPPSRGPSSRPPSRGPVSRGASLQRSSAPSRASQSRAASPPGSVAGGSQYGGSQYGGSQASPNSSRFSSRVPTNVSNASGASGISNSRYSQASGSTISSYSQGSRAPLVKGGSSSQVSSRAPSRAASQAPSSRAPSRAASQAPSSRGPPPSSQQLLQQSRGPSRQQSRQPQVGFQQTNSFRGSNNASQDFSNLSEDEWDQRARAKGRAPVLPQNMRDAAIDKLLTDLRRNTMFGGGAMKKGKVGAKELLSNAMRAVTIYDNAQKQGITDYDDSFMTEKKKDGEELMPWSPTASTEMFTRTKVGTFASNMVIGTALAAVFFGPIAIVWGTSIFIGDIFSDDLTLWLGVYTLILSVVLAGYEYFKGYERSGQPIPYRGFVYLALSVPLFLSYPLILVGSLLLCAAIANFRSYMMREEIAPMKAKKKMAGGAEGGIFNRFTLWRESNKVGKVVFLSFYILTNIVIYIVVLFEWYDINDALAPEDRLSTYGPYAKGFGGTLDFNCSVILLPVARTFIRWLYNISTRDQSFTSTLFRYILYFVPIDKTLAFHKLVAGFVLLGTIGHTFFHFINYINSESQTLAIFGESPWYTGGALVIIILIMYSAAVKNVRSFHFELFWYTHHLFIIWYVILLIHGTDFVNPNVWKYLIVPGALYTAERLLREYNANREAVILSVTFLKPDCFSVRFAKKGVFANGYKEGQYIFINCPYVSKFEWHPFTLSSAPGEDAASLHIRIQNRVTDAAASNKSWTQQTKEYLELLCPRGAVYHEFVSNAGQDVGVVHGPDGNPILRIDGPHSAPTQHISEYQTSMICGAGIGVTPLAATMKSIVHHRWRMAVGNAFPNNAHFYWVCAHRDIQAFRWMIRTIKDATDAVWNSRLKDEEFKKRSFSVTVFITSVPKDAQTPPLESIPGDSVGFWGAKRKDLRNIENTPAPFTEQEMYQVCMNPPKEPTQLCDLVTIYNGRPKWDDHYAKIAQLHPTNFDVGVMFCGNPAIADQLKEACARHSDVNKNLYFKLHKENF